MSDLARLRAATIDRALQRRPAGRPVAVVDPCSPLEAYRLAADQLAATLAAFDGRDWARPAHSEIGTVLDVVAHLVAVEEMAVGWVEADADASPVATEHVTATRGRMHALAGTAPRALVAMWAAGADRLQAVCARAEPTKPVLANDLPTDVEGLLVLRAFELWAHLQDICRATARPCPDLEPARLELMTQRLMGAVPVALLLRGVDLPAQQLRVVLIGPLERGYDIAVGGAAAGPPTLTLVADAVAVCQVAARRRTPDDLDVAVDGDLVTALRIVAALDAFARD